jgi:hypothetical protein
MRTCQDKAGWKSDHGNGSCGECGRNSELYGYNRVPIFAHYLAKVVGYNQYNPRCGQNTLDLTDTGSHSQRIPYWGLCEIAERKKPAVFPCRLRLFGVALLPWTRCGSKAPYLSLTPGTHREPQAWNALWSRKQGKVSGQSHMMERRSPPTQPKRKHSQSHSNGPRSGHEQGSKQSLLLRGRARVGSAGPLSPRMKPEFSAWNAGPGAPRLTFHTDDYANYAPHFTCVT